MPRNPVDTAIEQLHREQDGGERYVDLAVDFRLDGRVLLTAGGRWDRRLEDFDGEAETSIVVELHPGQRAAVEWFASWIGAHALRRIATATASPRTGLHARDALEHMAPEQMVAHDARLADRPELAAAIDTNPAHAYAALFAGGRRAGKTWIAVALAVTYAISFPGALVWLVSPTDTSDDEITRYASLFVPPEWVDHENQDGWWLCNRSQLLLRSAFNPEALKQGEANLVVLNEGQRMQHRAYVLARGAIVDHAGCVIVCANPPVEAKDQQWVADLAAQAQNGEAAALYHHFNPLDNPHIDRGALLALAAELDERTADIELWGMFRASADAVAYNWDRLQNERRVPDEGDCTALFLSIVGEGEDIRQLVGVDFQRIPYIGGPIYRFFGDPDRDRVLAWIAGEIVLDGGDEVDFCDAMLEQGLDPAETLIVGDASGQWQHSRRRTADAPPPEWTGRGSFAIIRGHRYPEWHDRAGELAGWKIVPPDRRQKRNPQIQDRVRALLAMIASDKGRRRRLFADPALAPRTCKALREWKTVHGAASRTQDVAHLGDGASYPIVRLFPRRILTAAARSTNPRPVNTGSSQPDTRTIPVHEALQLPPPRPRGTAPTARRGVRGRGL